MKQAAETRRGSGKQPAVGKAVSLESGLFVLLNARDGFFLAWLLCILFSATTKRSSEKTRTSPSKALHVRREESVLFWD